MLLRDYLQTVAGVSPTAVLRKSNDPHSLRQIGQFAIGDKHCIQLLSGNAIDIPDLTDMIDSICDEFRAADNWDFEVFGGSGRANRNTLFVIPKEELGRPYGRNLKKLRENLVFWTVTMSLSGELPEDVPRKNDPKTIKFRSPKWI